MTKREYSDWFKNYNYEEQEQEDVDDCKKKKSKILSLNKDETKTITTTSKKSKSKTTTSTLIGIKDPLLALSAEVLHLMKYRVCDPENLKVIFAIRDPLSMMVSWMHAGTPWLMHWDDPIHLSVGLLHEEIQTTLKILHVPELL